jgi:prepilin-type N-terminal cleavage/methylation domain-containing protein
MHVLNKNAGFTLIEVMIGMVILTIVSLGLTNLTVGVIRGNAFSKHMTTATTLAQDKLEHAKRLGYSTANTVVGTENYGAITSFPAFKRVTAVDNNTPAPAVKTVTVTVYWGSDTRSVASRTILAE